MPPTFPDGRLRAAGLSAARIAALRADYDASTPARQQTLRGILASATDETLRTVYEPEGPPPPEPQVPQPVAPTAVPKVAVWADSMGDAMNNDGASLWGGLATALGVETYDGAYGGHTSTEVALYHGGLPVFLTLPNNQIPAGTGQIVIPGIQPTGSYVASQWVSLEGTLAGVPSRLMHNGATNQWLYNRLTAGPVKTIQPEEQWHSTAGSSRAEWAHVFRVGRNNNGGNLTTAEQAIVLRDLTAMVRTIPHGRYIVLPVYNGTNFAAMNTALADRFGPNYYDLRGWMVRHGLAAAGITPTADDTTAVGAGNLPPSLMLDAVHMNTVARRVEATRVAALMAARGWFPTYTPLI
jgi:hypothetical protein